MYCVSYNLLKWNNVSYVLLFQCIFWLDIMARKVAREELALMRQEVLSQWGGQKAAFILGTIDAELLLKDGFSAFWVNETKELTTIVVVQCQGNASTYAFYSSNEEDLRQALHKIVNWNEVVLFAGPPIWSSFLIELAKTCAPESKLKVNNVSDCYCATKETTASIALPPGYTFDVLSLEDAEDVDSCWEHRQEGYSLELFRRQIQHLPSVAVRDKLGNLLGFELSGPFLTNFSLFVYPEHRHKGLGAAITCEMNKLMIAMRGIAYTCIIHGNEKSVQLHTKCGFNRMEGGVEWMMFLPSDRK